MEENDSERRSAPPLRARARPYAMCSAVALGFEEAWAASNGNHCSNVPTAQVFRHGFGTVIIGAGIAGVETLEALKTEGDAGAVGRARRVNKNCQGIDIEFVVGHT